MPRSQSHRLLTQQVLMIAFLISAALLPIHCGSTAQQTPPDLVSSANGFTLRAFELAKRDNPGNLFFAPLALHQGLTMISAGAKGRTASQLATVLLQTPMTNLSQEELQKQTNQYHASYGVLLAPFRPGSKQSAFHISNQLWGQAKLNWLPAFTDILKNDYAAPLIETDFGENFTLSEKAIQTWCADKTKNLIPPASTNKISRLARLVLANAVSLDAPWAQEFNKARTRVASFHLLSGEKTFVPLMHDQSKCRYGEDSNLQALAIPYADGVTEMLIILPRKIEDIETISDSLTPEKISRILTLMKNQEVNVYLPKFQTATTINAESLLTRMGTTGIFSPDADFSGAAKTQGLYLSTILHQAVIQVSEKGKEGSGMGAFVAALNQDNAQSVPLFRADRPFLFLVRHAPSGLILAMGRLMQPPLSTLANAAPAINPNGVSKTTKLKFGDSGRNIQAKKGDTIELNLEGNPTTGYKWNLAVQRGDAIHLAGEPTYQPASSAIGSGGIYTFILNAVKPGIAIIAFSYARPWEQGKAPLQVFNITITVTP